MKKKETKGALLNSKRMQSVFCVLQQGVTYIVSLEYVKKPE